jgi:hypothetical protein
MLKALRPRTALLAAVLLATFAGNVRAGAGATQGEFLKVGLSARAAAMGGAFGAVADDLGALEYNPAGLGLLNNSQLSAMYSRWLADISFGAIAGAHILPYLGTIAVGVNFLDTGEIEGSSRNFKASSFLLRVAWARSLTENLTVGVGAKIMREAISDFQSYGGTLDAGAIWSPVRDVSLGAVVMNLGTAQAFETERDALPLLTKFCFAYKALENDYGMLIAATDVDWYLPPANLLNPAVGLEYWGGRYFAIRAGYAWKKTDLSQFVGFTAGLGVRWESLRVDYTFAPFSSLGMTHRVTINWEIWPMITLAVPGSSVGESRAVYAGRILPPSPPFVSVEAGEGNVLLKWEAPQASNILGYNVYFKKEGDRNLRKFNDEPTASTTVIIGGLEANARYYFVVKSVDNAAPPRESVPSPTATAIPY